MPDPTEDLPDLFGYTPPVAKARPEPTQGLCADTNFFTRSACVYSECAKPANTALSMCVEHRNRLQKQADSVSGN